MPNVLWIWDIPTLALKRVLIHKNPIKHFAWSPVMPFLVICTGNNSIYFVY